MERLTPFSAKIFSASVKGKMLNNKAILCTGPDSQEFYNNAIELFDKQKDYTKSKTSFDGVEGKEYALVSKGNKEVSYVMLFSPNEEDPDAFYRAVIITVITKE